MLALLPLLLQIAPALAGLIAGKNAEQAAAVAVDVAKQVTGIDSPVDAVQALQADSGKAQQFRLAIEANRLEFAKLALEEVKAQYADTANARQRDIAVSTSENAPYLNKIIAPALALVVVIGGGLLLVFAEEADVRMAAVSLMTLACQFYFGTTAGKVKDSQALRDAIKQQ